MPNRPTYTIGSEKGYNIVNQLGTGQSTNDLAQEYRPSDGSVWTKNEQGGIDVLHQGVQMTGNVTYQPIAQDPLKRPPSAEITPVQPPVSTQSAPITTKPIVYGESSFVRPSTQPNRLTADDIKALYQQMQDQQNAKIDYTVQQAVDELNRAQEAAQKDYAKQRNKVNIDAAQARDAEALYAAARGDRGGITGSQYNSISNTAANNHAAINQAQQQLATDTARQIADLRAQGEFEKADALLQIAQQQLAQLWELQQYNDSLTMQEQQMAMQESQLTGQYNGTPTIDVQLADRELAYNQQLADREWQQALKEWDYNTAQQEREWAYEIAMQSIQAGIIPTADVLAAAGIDSNTASQMASIYRAAMTSSASGGGGGGGDDTGRDTPAPSEQSILHTIYGMQDEAQVVDYLISQGLTENERNTYLDYWFDRPAAYKVPSSGEIIAGRLDNAVYQSSATGSRVEQLRKELSAPGLTNQQKYNMIMRAYETTTSSGARSISSRDVTKLLDEFGL